MGNNYIMGTKRSGSTKAHMIDYIAGVFNNEASKYSCLKHVAAYFDEKTVEDIANETRLRRLLKNSTEKIVRNIYELCMQEYKHLAQYRDDALPKHPVGVARSDGFRYAEGDVVGGNYSKHFVTFEQFTMKEDVNNIAEEPIGVNYDDIYNRLTDIENQIKVYVSDYEVEAEFNPEIMESLNKCQRFVRRAIYNINQNATFEREYIAMNESNNTLTLDVIKENILNFLESLDSSENVKIERCKTLLSRCLKVLAN